MTKIDRLMQILRRNPFQQLAQFVRFLPDRLNNNPPRLLAHIHPVIQFEVRGLHHGGRNPHRRAVAHFFTVAFMVTSRASTLYLPVCPAWRAGVNNVRTGRLSE